MTETEIFEYLKENLYLDYERDFYGKSLTVMLKLRHPDDYEKITEIGSAYIDIPDIEVGGIRNDYY